MATSRTSGKSKGEDNQPVEGNNEAQRVIDHRFKRLVFAGWGAEEAEKVAARFQGPDYIDLHEAEELVRDKKCPVSLAAEILL